MLWFAPRSYLKWAAAVAVVGLSWWIQLMPAALVMHPFARGDLPAGTQVSEDMFEFRETPTGLLPATVPQGTLAAELAAGDPLLPSLLIQGGVSVPEGWWAVELEAPRGLTPGSSVMLVTASDGVSPGEPAVPGLVIRPLNGGDSSETSALIAVPGEHLVQVSSASAYGGLTVAVTPNR